MKKIWAVILIGIMLVSTATAAVTASAAVQNDAPEATQAPTVTQTPTEAPTQAPTQTPDIPRITKITSVQGGVTLTYTAYKGAAKYRIFTKKADGSGWKGIADTASLTYTRKIAEGTSDIYTVRALDKNGKFCSGYDKNGYAFTLLKVPALKKAESVNGGVKITWSAVSGASRYRVYVKNGTGWKGIGNTDIASFVDTSAESGSSYTYTVRAIEPVAVNPVSYYDRTGVSVNYIAAPAVTAFTPAEGGTKVTWGKVKGGVMYRLFYKKEDGSGWKGIASTTGATLTHTDPVNGTEYIYTVRVTDKNGKYISGFDSTGWAYRYIESPRIIGVTAVNNEVHLDWLASPYAAVYRVYRKEFGGKWSALGQTKRLTYTDRSFSPDTLYAYSLRSVDADFHLNSYYNNEVQYYYNGKLADGEITVNGTPLLFENGYPHQGFVTLDGKTYYYDKNGVLLKDGIVGSDEEGWRCADKNGVVDMTFTGVAGDGSTYWYLKKGQVDKTARIALSYNGSQWNILNGKARKVVTEEDKVLYRALQLVNKVTKSTMTKEEKLRAMWDYVRDAYVEKNPRIPHYRGMDWPIIYANDMLINGVGNCMSYGAEFCYIAKAIGYKDCYACHSGGHGWAEIEGLIYDVEWSRHVFKYNYYALSYDTKVDQNYKGAISAGEPWMHVKVCADYDD